MSDLTEVTLATFADITMGQSPDSESINSEGQGLPFLQGCAEFGRKSPRAEVFCSPALRVGKADSILVSVRAPVGTMNYADQDYCIGRGLAAIKAKQSLGCVGFLKHAIELNSGFLHRRSQGSTFFAISSADIRQVPIPYFPLAKQTKIAVILTSLDTAIEKSEALVEKRQQIKAGLMHNLFTRGVLPNGQLRPPREQAPELYKQTVLGDFPLSWRVTELAAACEAVIDCPHSTPSFTQDGVLVARTMHIKKGVFIEELASRVSEAEYRERVFRLEPRTGDVIFTREAPVGEAFLIPQGMRVCLGQRVMLIRPKSGALNGTYLVAQVYSGLLQARIADLVSGTTNPHLNVADVRALQIPLPPKAEQDQVSACIDAAAEQLNKEQGKLEKLHKQKLGLMQDLLTGKVPVKIADSEAVPV